MTAAAPGAIDALLSDAIARRVTPGAVVEAGTSRGVAWQAVAGRHTYAADAPAVDVDTIYDLASLTKVLATTTLAMRAHVTGTLPVDTRVATRRGEYASRLPFTVGDLLQHCAGFPAHRPFYQAVAGRAGYLARLAGEPLVYTPRDRHEYTDLGFLLLGVLLEDAAGTTLDRQFDQWRDEAIPRAAVGFGVRPDWRSRTAPTGVCPWRGRVINGSVHDANAAALGGVAPHAGLFGTAPAIGQAARWLMTLWRGDVEASAGVTSAVVRQFASVGRIPGSSRALGWDTMLPTSSCGTRLSTRSIGHTGFTGTSLWIDPERDLYVVLLTNRVHASDDLEGIRRLRIATHDAVADAWDAR
ncbi:MAG: serine hydrolase domain-containing protein [Vicinamibacterales bacterium]